MSSYVQHQSKIWKVCSFLEYGCIIIASVLQRWMVWCSVVGYSFHSLEVIPNIKNTC
uniref:Uncharacterized protein n=1 Tax=Octopus bimaculoides TaxID=37653 RepID=A0A0L8FPI7_OCTBM